ncbi:MAG: glycosyltransferase [Oscillospiraceae bacterium]|nr:glycosyltransferase [Oscillospiraceae bacterium]
MAWLPSDDGGCAGQAFAQQGGEKQIGGKTIVDALILSCGTGGGHDSAGKAVQKELERRGHHAVMLNPYRLHSDRLADRIDNVYLFLAKQAPWLFGVVYQAGQLYRKLPVRSPVYYANQKMVSTMEKYLAEHPADVVIMTHVFPAEIMTSMKRQGMHIPKTIFVATDYACIPFTEETECDAYVTPSERLTEQFMAYGLATEKLHPLGIPTNSSFSRCESREDTRRQLGLDANKQYILVSAGSMGGGKIKKAVKILTACVAGRENIELIVICGSNQKLYQQLKASAAPNMKVIGYTNDMASYMKAADLFVTKPGGLSSTEAAVCGVPILHTAAIPGCETLNARFFHECGMSVSCKTSKCGSAAMELMDKADACAAMVGRQRRLISPNAAANIGDLAEALSKAPVDCAL